jgi:hypothetical protein
MLKTDMKLYMINSLTAMVTTLSHMETALKIILLAVTIGYTVSKWIGKKVENEDNKKL